ncbi:hypothetical protein [Epilithonimonas caeni]|uniref:hypothetical protein n=1 Tax=Epilithonimonas caeni TaxID=365343 RepID=UPI00041D28EC|nr:hypothetical protein [Epilithonimonas caeni]
MKKVYLSIALVAFGLTFGQVGVNTNSPKTTLDVSAKRDVSGSITDNTQHIGLQSPRLTRAELTNNTATYGVDQTAALIYVTDVSGGDTNIPRTHVDSPGYYYFDGVLWQKFTGGIASGGTEPWKVRTTDTEATLNTQDIYQKGNVAVGTSQGLGTFHIDAVKDNPSTGTPTTTQVLDDIIVTPKGRVGVGYSPSDTVFGSNQFDDKWTLQANSDLDINYSLATTNNAQAIVHRNIISSGTIGARTARPNGTSITAFEGHTSTSSNNYGLTTAVTQQRAGIVLRTGKYTSVGGEIWLGTSGANSDGSASSTAVNVYRAIMDERGNWSLGADPNVDAFYRNPTQRLDLILGGVRIDALGYGTLAAWQTLQAAQRPNYISTNPNDRIVVVDANGVLKTIDRSVLAKSSIVEEKSQSQLRIVKNASDITPAIIQGCPVYDNEATAQTDEVLPEGGLYRIKGSGVLMIKY